MSKKKAILTTLGAVGAVAATGGLAGIGIPGLVGGGAAAGGAGATAAGAAARTGMSLGTKLALGSGIAQAAGSLYGTKVQADASRRAANTQTDYGNRALADEQAQRAKLEAAYAAWLNGPEMAGLGRFGQAPPQGGTPTASEPPRTLGSLVNVGSGQTPAAAANKVTLQAPTGATRQFAANDPAIAKHLARGARRL